MRQFIASLIVLVSASASTLIGQNTVHVPSQQPTILVALFFAQPGDIIEVAPGTYGEDITFFGKDVIVRSTGGAAVTFLEGFGFNPLIEFAGGETRAAILDGFTLRNGQGDSDRGGAIHIDGASPTIRNCVFHDNLGGGVSQGFAASRGRGGAIQCQGTGSFPLIENCHFQDNTGGPLPMLPGIPNPFAGRSGAGAIQFEDNAEGLVVDCSFANNLGGDSASALPGAAVSIDQNSFGGAGAATILSGASVTFSGCRFTDNQAGPSYAASGSGGALNVRNGQIAVNHCTFVGNSGGTQLSSNSATVAENKGGAGAIHVLNGELIIRSSLLARNEGGIYQPNLLYANGGGGAGAVFFQGGVASHIDSCTITSNIGAPSIVGQSSNNLGPATGGVEVDGPLSLTQSILWMNQGAVGGINEAHDLNGPAFFATNSIVEGGLPSAGVINADPLFVDAANDDWRITPNSPAIDAVTTPPTALVDVEGEPRDFYARPDFGADEYISAATRGTVLDAQGELEPVLFVDGQTSLTVNVASATPFPVAVAQPSTSANPANFVVIGRFGRPLVNEEVFLSNSIGSYILPLGQPSTFVLLNSFSPFPGQIAASGPAPGAIAIGALPPGLDFALQAILEVNPGTLRCSNAVQLRIF